MLELGEQRVEYGQALAERFGVARQSEVRIDALSDGIGDILDEQGREVASPVTDAHAAKGPFEILIFVADRTNVSKARPFGQ